MVHSVVRMLLMVSLMPASLYAQPHAHPRPRGGHHGPTVPAPASADTLVAPRTLVNASRIPDVVEVTLTAAPARLSLVANTTSDVFAYNGQVPGPTLELYEGDSVIVHFRNALPVATTIHWHGLHIPFVQDGSPFHPIAAGAQHDYAFRIKRGAAGTYWYHPHPHHETSYQISKGLYGAIIVRDPDDPLPRTLTEKLIILSDNRLLGDGSIDLPDPDSPQGRMDFENGREGDLVFVNGTLMPELTIRSGEVQRWRVLNASGARVYRLALSGHTFQWVGTGGGLFEHPEEVSEILLANAERVELLVRGTGTPGSRAVLQSLPYDRYVPQTRPRDWDRPRDLLAVRYTSEVAVTPPDLPRSLRVVPPLDTMQATARREIVLTQGMINGQLMDLNRIDERSTLGTTEIWQIENLVGMDHPFHLHGFQFQVIERDGVPEKARRWKDTVNVPKHSMVRFIVRFENYPGKWMYHCHILTHEDHGMMGVLEIR